MSVLFGLVLTIGLSACGGGPSGDDPKGYYCESTPGCNTPLGKLARNLVDRINQNPDRKSPVTLMKILTKQPGYIVMRDYSRGPSVTFLAINLDDYNKNVDVDVFLSEADTHIVWWADTNDGRRHSFQDDHHGPDHVTIYSLPSNVVGGNSSKNLSPMVGLKRKLNSVEVTKKLEDAGFNEEDSRRIAQDVIDYRGKMNNRSVTEQDSIAFFASMGVNDEIIRNTAEAIQDAAVSNDFSIAASMMAEAVSGTLTTDRETLKKIFLEEIEAGI